VAHIRTAPAVDHLVVVPDREEIVLRQGEQVHEQDLGGVEILEFVDQDEAEALLQLLAQPRALEQQHQGEVDHVVEIAEPPRLLQGEKGLEDGGEREALLLGLHHHLLEGQQFHFGAVEGGEKGLEGVLAAPRCQPVVAGDGLLHHQPQLFLFAGAVITPAQDAADDLVTEAVEGAHDHPRLVQPLGHRDAAGLQPRRHLIGSLFVEGERDNPARFDPLVEKMDDPVDQGAGFARARRRQHPDRPLQMGDSGALAGVKILVERINGSGEEGLLRGPFPEGGELLQIESLPQRRTVAVQSGAADRLPVGLPRRLREQDQGCARQPCGQKQPVQQRLQPAGQLRHRQILPEEQGRRVGLFGPVLQMVAADDTMGDAPGLEGGTQRRQIAFRKAKAEEIRRPLRRLRQRRDILLQIHVRLVR